MLLPRRRLAVLGAAALLPHVAVGQSDSRPTMTVAVQVISTSNTLTAISEQSNVGTRLSPLINETLIGLDYQRALQQVPGLATAWRRIDDRTVELDLRRDVKFHNGETMTAEDVAFSFSGQLKFGDTRPLVDGRTLPLPPGRIMRAGKEPPAQVPAIARRLFPGFDQIDVIDRHTIRFVNATPDVTLEGRLSLTGSQIFSQKAFDAASAWLDFARKPVSSGPYRVREFVADTLLVLDAHDEYWGGRPPIKTLRFVQVPEAASRVNGLLSGEYQFACDITPDQISEIERNPEFEVQGGFIPNHRIMIFDKNHPALRDARVRLAMAHSIDRTAIVDGLWAGKTRIPAGLQFEFYDDMFIKGWTVPEFNPARARQLLAEAGYKGEPIPYRLNNNYYTNQAATAQVLVEGWRQVGLNIDLQMKENSSQIWTKEGGRGIHDWSNSAAFNDPVCSIVAQHGPNGQQQQAGMWANAEMNRISVEMEMSTDRARRRVLFARMLEICEREDPAYTVLHQTATFIAKPKRIKWKAAPSFAMDFRKQNWG